jgi:hypothetical protein
VSDWAFWTDLRPHTELGAWPAVENARVYVCVPPMLTAAGASEFVIVTQHGETGVAELFAADENGSIEEWEPLAEYVGATHEKALRAMGFEVVAIDAA